MPNKTKKAIEQFETIEEDSKPCSMITVRLIIVAAVCLLCNFVLWIAWIRPIYADSVMGSFLLFVVFPFAVMLVAMAACSWGMHMRAEEMIKKTAMLEATKQAKEIFFSKMSNEIRTPINAILGMDEIILKEEINPSVESSAVSIKRAGQNLLAIVNDIVDSSKLEAGMLSLSESEYDFMSVLIEAYNLIHVRTEEKGLELRIVNALELPRILMGDEMRVKQIIINLLSNAVKYTKDGYVELNVSGKKRDDDSIELIISVKDSGIGITAEERESLFDTFERLDEKRNRYIEGVGIGLSITKQLAELMGGSISVESVVDEGSEFTVVIPQGIAGNESMGDFYKELAKAVPGESGEHERFTFDGTRILVVDDVQVNLDVFKGLLKKSGIEIDAAICGETAVRLAKKKMYDMIFMDHLMPGMDGVETMKAIRGISEEYAHTPVIALTANITEKSEEEYKELGFDAFVAKPVKGRILEETIAGFVPRTVVS